MPRSECTIVGGGVAGLTAAIALAKQGVFVRLIEEKPNCGGRAYSFTDRETNDQLDNGQHLLAGCYYSFLHFLREIGTEQKILRPKKLRLPFKHRDGREAELKVDFLPHPFGLVGAILRYSILSVRERLAVLRFMIRLRFVSEADLDELDEISVLEWLRSEKQSQHTIECFWNVIALATLNADAAYSSAKLFAIVVKQMFLSSARASTLLAPTVSLSELYVDNALALLKRYNGEVILHNGVRKIIWQDNKICGLLLRDGTLLETSAVIFAIPPVKLQKLIPIEWQQDEPFDALHRFQFSEIASYHVWSKTRITEEPMTGFLGSPLQWIFSKGKSQDGNWLYSCVISSAQSQKAQTQSAADDASCEMIIQTLRDFYPHITRNTITKIVAIREKSATFLPLPMMESARPGVHTAFDNAYLAGDWTATHLPATLEGAARSGYQAAEAFMKGNRKEREIDFRYQHVPTHHG